MGRGEVTSPRQRSGCLDDFRGARVVLAVTAYLVATGIMGGTGGQALADRFPEGFVRSLPAADGEARRTISRTYLIEAQGARSRGRQYQADHFARRAIYFRQEKTNLKMPTFVLKADSLGLDNVTRVEAMRIQLQHHLACAEANAPLMPQLRAVIALERLALDLLANPDRPLPQARSARVAGAIEELEPSTVASCKDLPEVKVDVTQMDWEFNSGAPIPDVQSGDGFVAPDSKGQPRPAVFGRKLDSRGGPYRPCNVDPGQRTVYFEFDDDVIHTAAAAQEIAAVAETTGADGRVTVEGHADSAGPRLRNDALSVARADAVRALLIAEGVPADHIRTVALGAHCPQRSVGPDASVTANRRATLKVER